jgi:predicted enzyme related to lactoylglutathione lyase
LDREEERTLMKLIKTYFMVMVDDMDRATTFYRDVFGLAVRFVSPEWSELASGDATVAFHGGRNGTDQRTTGLGFEVDDLEDACAAVEMGGGTIVMPPSERPGEQIRLAEVSDPEGNVVSIAQQV